MREPTFGGMPSLEMFLKIELPEAVFEGDTPEFRKDIYLICLSYYKTGWENCADNMAQAAGDLLYFEFPDETKEKNDEQA